MVDPDRDARRSTILLTGSAGGIGRHLRTLLASRGHHVRGMDIDGTADPGSDLHAADLRDLDAVRRLARGVDAIVHAGAIPYDTGDGAQVMATNVLGTWNVLQAAQEAGVRRVIAFSSINAQGSVGGWRPTVRLPIDDEYPAHPLTPYQLSKHLGEEMCRSFSERHGMITLCLRPVWVTGAHHYASAGFGTEPFVRDWKDQFWAYVDVRDVGEAVIHCLSLEGVQHDRFLLAAADTSAHLPTRDLLMREHAQVPWPRHDRDTWLAGDAYRGLIDCHHARSVLGWTPRHSWRDSPGRPIPESEVRP